MDDAQLLRRYGDDRSEPDFTELVRRHVDLVFSAALRQVGGDRHKAEEVTQMVFTDLARKASSLSRHPVILAWLYNSTRFAAANVRRAEHRRRVHEQAAAAELPAGEDLASRAEWDRLRLVLDEAMNELSASDREAVLLRFFANRPFAEIGRQLGLTENAARMRVERSLDKLHTLLCRRGIVSTAGALAVALSGNAVFAAPAGVAAVATGAALSAAAVGGGTLTPLHLMNSIKFSTTLAGVVLSVGAVVWQHQGNARLQRAIDDFGQPGGYVDAAGNAAQIRAVRADNERLTQSLAAVADLREANADLDRLRAAVQTRAMKAKAPDSPDGLAHSASPFPAGVYNYATLLDQQPVPTFQGSPVYPPALKQQGSEGRTMIDFVVAADGTATHVTALDATDPAFAAAAIAAVQQWRFQPGQVAGSPVSVRVQVPITFNIQDRSGNWF